MKIKAGWKSQKSQRGSILVLTLFFMILISFFAIAFWRLIPVELHQANRHKLDTAAYYAADNGVADTMLWLAERTRQGNIDPVFNNGAITRTGTLDGWTWTVRVVPGPETFGSPGVTSPNPIRCYRLESVASLGNRKYRKVTVWSLQRSFAEYGWYFDKFASGTELWLNLANFRLDGRYHTNEQMLLYTNGNGFSWSGDAAFSDKATFRLRTTSGVSGLGDVDGVRYNTWTSASLPYSTTNGSPVPGRYERISTQGLLGLQSTSQINMPQSSDDVRKGAWGETLPGTLSSGDAIFGSSGVNAHVNADLGGDANAGIYIEGNVDQVEYRLVNASGGVVSQPSAAGPTPPDVNQNVRIRQGTNIIGVTHIKEAPLTIPAGSVINGVPITANRTLNGADNAGYGHTVIEKLNSNGNPLSFGSPNDGNQPRPREFVQYNRQTNGVIYSTGHIDGVRGTIQGRRTLATRTDEGNSVTHDKVIRINGELLYAGTERGKRPSTAEDQLGLISYAVRMKGPQHGGTSPPSNLQPPTITDGGMWPRRGATTSASPHLLYCSIFAGRRGDPSVNWANQEGMLRGGGFGVEESSNTAADIALGHGYMNVFGSLSEGVRQRKGTIDTSGYNYQNVYDTNLKTVQPPYFPSLPEYRVQLWEEESLYSY